MKIKKVAGLFPGTWKYFIGDYTFHKDYKSKSPRYTCTSKRTVSRCPVVAKKVGDDYISIPTEHTHPKPPKCRKNKLTKKIKHLAAKTFSTSTTICNELNKDMKKSRLSPTAVKICVSRTRKSLLPEAPKEFTELKDTLKNYSKTACIFRGEVMSEDGSAIILSDKELIEHIGDVDEIQIDKTYENVPVDVPFKQLLIFHLRKNNIGLPSIFVMCNSTSGSMYSQLWSNLIDRVPSIQQNLKSVICDYDPVLMSVTKSSLCGIQVRGSWFGYIRMTCRLWRSMDLKENLLHDVLRYTWLIILLPAERFKEAINEIIATIKDTIELYDESEQNLNEFIHSLEAWLLPQAESISVNENYDKAINIGEYFNRHIVNNLGGYNPKLFTYLERIRNICCESNDRWKKLQNGSELLGLKCYRYVIIDKHIRQNLDDLNSGKLTMIDFLKNALTTSLYEEILHQLNSIQYKDDDKKIIHLPDPSLFTV